MTVHVVGNLCLDRSFRLPRLPRAGETVNAATGDEGPGGKGANQAVAAARCGAATQLYAAIGKDGTGDALAARIGAEGVALALTRLDVPTDMSAILVDAGGENMIVTAAACAAAFNPLAMTDLGTAIHTGDILLMQGNLGLEATNACIAAALAAGARVILNPSPLVAGAPALAGCFLVIANRLEAEMLTGAADPAAAAVALLNQGAAHAVVTLGADGAILAGPGSALIHRPAIPAVTVDTSGAGDCLAGTLAGLVAGGTDLGAALEIAMAAAAIAVGRPGTLDSFPTRPEVAALVRAAQTSRLSS